MRIFAKQFHCSHFTSPHFPFPLSAPHRSSIFYLSVLRHGLGGGAACAACDVWSLLGRVRESAAMLLYLLQERWLEHSATIAGGRAPTLRAKQMWDEWSRNKDHGNDHLGPDGALQLYVRVDVEVHHDDTYAKGKSVRRGDRPMKDATEDQLCKLRKRMLTGHEDFGQATFGTSENKLNFSYMHATAVPLSLLVSFWVGRHSATLLWDNLSGSVAEG